MTGADRPDAAPPQTSKPEREDPRQRIRPYTMTGGRTNPTRADLELEALVATRRHGPPASADLVLEQRSIVELCRETLSIAEVSARLGIPINVVKILVGDLADAGLVVPDQAGGWPAPEGSDRVSTSARISASG
jgi:uncharacterized protein DUF742